VPSQDAATRTLRQMIQAWLEEHEPPPRTGYERIDEGAIADLAGEITDYFRREGEITLDPIREV
jgi:hypothetical protein